jgi:hypothetical protein
MALQDLSIINIARIHYKIERFDEAFNYYQLVPQNSVYRQQAEFEMEWAYFMAGSASGSIPDDVIVKNRQTSAKREAKLDKKRAKGKAPLRDFIPEATHLLALRQFNHCGYRCVDETLLSFESRMQPIQEELKTYVKGYATKESRRMADKAWDDYFGPRAKQTTIPKSLFTRMLRNQDIRGLVDHMALMDDELDLIDKQKPQWRDTVGEMLRQDVIEKDRRKFKVRAGKFMLAQMARYANILQDLLTNSEIVRFEMNDAQRVDYQYKFAGCETPQEMVCTSPEGF